MFRLLIFLITLCIVTPCLASAGANEASLVRVGAYSNPPKIDITREGKVIGFWPELISYIAAHEGWEVEYVKGKWGEGLTALENGRIDIMPDVAFTKKRAGLFTFSTVTMMTSWSRVYIRESETEISSLEDLRNKRIAGLSGSANLEGPDGIKRMVQSFNMKCQVVEMDSYTDVFQALEDGFVDAVITNRNFGDEYTKTHPVKKTPIVLSPVSITFAFPKNSEKTDMLLRKVDKHLNTLMSDPDSIYYKLLTKYFESEIAEKKITVLPAWFKLLTAMIAISLAMAIVFAYLFRIRLKQKTKELHLLNEELQTRVQNETLKRVQNEQLLFEQKKFIDMGNMMGAISHQWRQPLNNIYLMSQWLYEQWQEGAKLSKQHEETFNEQSVIISQMSSVIDDFRLFFKTDEDKRFFCVPETVLSCVRLITPELLSKKIHIKMQLISNGKPVEISTSHDILNCSETGFYTIAPEGELKQIVLSLISNAKDAVYDLDSQDKNILVNISSDKEYVYISVEDNGGGIPEDIFPRIFDPYFTTKQEGSGLGLGLYVSRMMIQKHMGGNISLENTSKGAKATVRLKKATA